MIRIVDKKVERKNKILGVITGTGPDQSLPILPKQKPVG